MRHDSQTGLPKRLESFDSPTCCSSQVVVQEDQTRTPTLNPDVDRSLVTFYCCGPGHKARRARANSFACFQLDAVGRHPDVIPSDAAGHHHVVIPATDTVESIVTLSQCTSWVPIFWFS